MPRIEDYATVESYCKDVPVYAFGFTYIYGVSPDLLAGAELQIGNKRPVVKIQPKKSWEIKHSLCGSTPAREPKTMWNNDQPLLPIHLIDGEPETAWSSRGMTDADVQPEWIRIDLPAESTVSAVVLVCCKRGPGAGTGYGRGLKPGKALPGAITVKLSCDSKNWQTVFESTDFSGPDDGPSKIEFTPQTAKQIWIIGGKLKPVQNWGPSFSIGEVQVLDSAGQNLALASRGAAVTVSSTYHGYGMDRFTQEMLWPVQYDLGFKWTRVGYDMGMFLWSYVEREKGKLQIDARADQAITEAHRNGVNVILCLDKGNWLYHNPPRKTDWKKSRITELMETYYDHQGWPDDNPAMMKGWLRYVAYMAKHFKDRVAYFEILNEWVGPLGVDRYVKIIKNAIPVIRRVAPRAKIMLGSTGEFDQKTMLDCLRAGLAEKVDAIGWHPFYHVDPDVEVYRTYRQVVAEFKKECAALGFKGQYAATEWTWAAPVPYPKNPPGVNALGYCSEMQKAKYAAQLMVAHCGMDVISLYNETFSCGRIDYDVGLFRNSSFQVDPISPAQPQPVYYILRTIATVLDGFQPAEFPVHIRSDKQIECYTFKKGRNNYLLACWLPGQTGDGIRETASDITFPALGGRGGERVKKAFAVDSLNGTEQELKIDRKGNETVLKGILIKDFPIFIRCETSR